MEEHDGDGVRLATEERCEVDTVLVRVQRVLDGDRELRKSVDMFLVLLPVQLFFCASDSAEQRNERRQHWLTSRTRSASTLSPFPSNHS